MTVLNLIIFILLMLISYQDFRRREIDWILFPVLISIFIIQGFYQYPFTQFILTCAINLSLLSAQICLLFFYYALKGKTVKSIVNSSLGTGDLAFLASITLAFTPLNFIFFYLSGLIFSLIIWLILKNIISGDNKLIPLAGMLSVYTSIIFITDLISESFDRLNDNYLIQLIYGR